MEKIDWKRKLSSRKFWVAIVGLIGAVGALFGLSNGSLEQLTTIVMSGGALIAYVLGESWVDAKQAESGDIAETTLTATTVYKDKPPNLEA